MFYVYVLKSAKDNNLYLGSTSDLKKRFKERNIGRIYSTKSRRPLTMVYCEAYKDESESRAREHNLKLRANALNQLKRRIQKSIKCGDK